MSKDNYLEAKALVSDNPGQYEIELARTLASLAIAEELKTANLIAYLAHVHASGSDLPEATPRSVQRAVLRDIETRLGLA